MAIERHVNRIRHGASVGDVLSFGGRASNSIEISVSVPSGCAGRCALVAGAFVLFACGYAAAHHDSAYGARASAMSATVEVFDGTIAQLIVENRVTNITTRHVALRMDDGTLIALRGAGLDALTEGARVQASGRMSASGMKFFGRPFVNSFPALMSSIAPGWRLRRLSTRMMPGAVVL